MQLGVCSVCDEGVGRRQGKEREVKRRERLTLEVERGVMAFAAGGNRWLLMDVHRSE